MIFRLILAALIPAIFASCKKNDSDSVDFHEDYFPTTQGKYVVYSVREVEVDANVSINDTNEYFLKTLIGDTITDNSGRTARRYERYTGATSSGPWVLKDIWTTIRDGNRIELVEENQRTIKLVLAPDKLKEWDANAFNMLGTLECYYDGIHEPGGINGFQFDSTVTVEQQSYYTLIDYRRKFEKYAKGVGMYYKHFKDYTINNFDTLNLQQGRELIMKLVDYGTE
jgi:hypothetical protein